MITIEAFCFFHLYIRLYLTTFVKKYLSLTDFIK
jgi:hypothetical protein